jgi:hypothetical protein
MGNTFSVEWLISDLRQVGLRCTNLCRALHGGGEKVAGVTLFWPINHQWVLMQDVALCHTSTATLKFFEERSRVLPQRPSNSPDLNPNAMRAAL